jgi:hypothetical protein
MERRRSAAGIAVAKKNEEIYAALEARTANVMGGTSFLWSRGEMTDAVDVLFIDEAGQMALADVISVAHAAKSLVLIGDPQATGAAAEGKPSGRGGKIGAGTFAGRAQDDFARGGITAAADMAATSRDLPVYVASILRRSVEITRCAEGLRDSGACVGEGRGIVVCAGEA